MEDANTVLICILAVTLQYIKRVYFLPSLERSQFCNFLIRLLNIGSVWFSKVFFRNSP